MSLFGRSLADGDRLEVAGAVVRLKVHSRARRVSLRLDRTRREIIATAPSLRRLPEAAAFARDRAAWIADRLAELPDAEAVAPGVVITLFGQPCRLEASDKPARLHPATGEAPACITARGEGAAFASGPASAGSFPRQPKHQMGWPECGRAPLPASNRRGVGA